MPELFFFGLPRNLYLAPDNLLSGEMMKKFLILVLLSVLVFPTGVSALVTYSGDSVIINDPVNDDIFATGSTIEVNAPVHSIVAAGGTITINAPVRGDVVAAGGTVTINNDVGGKVVAVGGSVDLAGNVSTNAVIQGGTVNIRKSATIGKDASISAGSVRNAGTVTGTLSVQSPSVENTGSAGTFDLKSDHSRGKLSLWFIPLVAFLLIIGWFIVGILLIRIMPVRFLQVESEVRTGTVVRCVAGFAGIIIAFVAFVLLAITIVTPSPCPDSRSTGPCRPPDRKPLRRFKPGADHFQVPEVERNGMATLYPRIRGTPHPLPAPGHQYPHICNQRQPWIWSNSLCSQEQLGSHHRISPFLILMECYDNRDP